MNIPFFGLTRQYNNIKEEVLDATDRVLSSGQLVNGPYTRQFEDWLAVKCQAKYAVTVHSGTQALEIIARYKKLRHEEVMHGPATVRIPNLTYPATLNAFVNAGWEIELDDTDKYGILRFETDQKTAPRMAGIYDCLVGLYGKQPWEHAKIEVAFGIIVDGAQHWLECNGQVGSGMAISFDPTKNLNASGNGGAIITNDTGLQKFALSFRDNYKPNFNSAGTNTKMSEQDCAQILVKTKYISEWQIRRNEISKYWCEKFRELPVMCLNAVATPHAQQKFVLYLNDRNSLSYHLLNKGIQTKVHYEQTLAELEVAKNFSKPDILSTSHMLSRGVLSLPIYPELSDLEVEYIANTVKSYFA